ncbi:MAG: hypothetical protein R3C53_05170 [Pirellulaceae bacterium]
MIRFPTELRLTVLAFVLLVAPVAAQEHSILEKSPKSGLADGVKPIDELPEPEELPTPAAESTASEPKTISNLAPVPLVEPAPRAASMVPAAVAPPPAGAKSAQPTPANRNGLAPTATPKSVLNDNRLDARSAGQTVRPASATVPAALPRQLGENSGNRGWPNAASPRLPPAPNIVVLGRRFGRGIALPLPPPILLGPLGPAPQLGVAPRVLPAPPLPSPPPRPFARMGGRFR